MLVLITSVSTFFLARLGRLFSFKILFRKVPRKMAKMVSILLYIVGNRVSSWRWAYLLRLLFESKTFHSLYILHGRCLSSIFDIWLEFRDCTRNCCPNYDRIFVIAFLWWGNWLIRYSVYVNSRSLRWKYCGDLEWDIYIPCLWPLLFSFCIYFGRNHGSWVIYSQFVLLVPWLKSINS